MCVCVCVCVCSCICVCGVCVRKCVCVHAQEEGIMDKSVQSSLLIHGNIDRDG